MYAEAVLPCLVWAVTQWTAARAKLRCLGGESSPCVHTADECVRKVEPESYRQDRLRSCVALQRNPLPSGANMSPLAANIVNY